ncbi:MAG: TraB/GumN family protein, partial [Prosthecobacter sp.]
PIQVARSHSDGSADGCVWVVDSEQNGRLYLCGTIHILREQDYPLAPGYEAAYRGSDKLLLELPPGKGSGPELSMKMSQLGTFSSDTSLEANVSTQAWEAVQTWAAKRGLDPSSMKRFRPWFVSLLMTSKEYALLGATPELGVDKHFSARAATDGKLGEGLETDDFQLQMFTSLTNEQQQELLDQTLAELSTVPDEYAKMILAWKKGDLPALHAMLFRETEKHPELMSLFLTNRNRVWVEKLDVMLRRGEKVMVLVGTGHLTGDAGLIELLKKRGYPVRHYREVEHF